MTLSAVPDDDDLDARPTPEYENRSPVGVTGEIPTFEGKKVSFTKAKITSVTGLEIDDQVFRLDEYVRMEIEGRIVAIDHTVNDKTGHMERVHLIKAIDSKVIPWDESRA